MPDLAYRIANAIRTFTGSKNRIQPTTAIIAAAGSSVRMQQTAGGPTKQHMCVGGIPVAVRSLLAFEECGFIDEIIVCAREDEISIFENYREAYNISKLKKIVPGGATRQLSVLRGFEAINPKAKFVAIHDGARCLVTPDIIEEVCMEAYRYRAAIAATAVRDTVKVAGKRNFIETTPDRNLVWLAQTPQAFYVPLYRAAAYSAREDKFTATDDAQLCERIKYPVRLVECGRENIKITTPDDISLANCILAARESSAGRSGDVFNKQTEKTR